MGQVLEKLGEKEGYIEASVNTEIVDKVREIYPNLLNRKVYNFGFLPEFAGVTSNV